jgi:hypothetical protein
VDRFAGAVADGAEAPDVGAVERRRPAAWSTGDARLELDVGLGHGAERAAEVGPLEPTGQAVTPVKQIFARGVAAFVLVDEEARVDVIAPHAMAVGERREAGGTRAARGGAAIPC